MILFDESVFSGPAIMTMTVCISIQAAFLLSGLRACGDDNAGNESEVLYEKGC